MRTILTHNGRSSLKMTSCFSLSRNMNNLSTSIRNIISASLKDFHMKTYTDNKNGNSTQGQKQRRKTEEAVKTNVSWKVSIACRYRMGAD